MELTKQRAEEILKRAEKDNALFNWCDEYNKFIEENVYICLSAEIDYIIKRSYEDNDTPLSYEDVDEAKQESIKEKDIIERIAYNLPFGEKRTEEEIKKAINEEDNEEHDFLKDKYDEAKQELINETEIYEWYAIADRLYYLLEKEGEILLNGYLWGRCCTGQAVNLDNCCIDAFIRFLKDAYI